MNPYASEVVIAGNSLFISSLIGCMDSSFD
jgi:hypothetical protein